MIEDDDRWTLVLDGCPYCLHRNTVPVGIREASASYISLDYRCRECGHTWWTTWARELADVCAQSTAHFRMVH